MTDSDNVELKKRSRRRLVGAAALALFAAIVLPMVMDQEPESPTQDIQVTIPDREANAALARPIAGQAPQAEPQLAPPPEEQAPAAGQADAVPPEAPATSVAAAAPKIPPVESARQEPSPKVPTAPEGGKAASTGGKVDADRARAILEGRSAPAGEPSAEAFVVQIGAFSEAGKATSIATDLRKQGFAAYTEKAGSMTRVRIGPFRGRDQAEEAARRLRASGLSGSVMSR